MFRNPGNSFQRQKLISHYACLKDKDTDARLAFEKHALYLIENDPQSEFIQEIPISKKNESSAYCKAENLWLKHIESDPGNVKLLENAYCYYMTKHLGVCGLIAKRLRELEPQSVFRVMELVRYFRHMASVCRQEDRNLFAYNAFLELKEAYERLPAGLNFEILLELPEAAYEAGLQLDLRNYCFLLLTRLELRVLVDSDDTEGFHRAYSWLARSEFERKNYKAARDYFFKSARYRPATPMSLVGPDLYLANEFLKMKEYSVVLKYLKICSRTYNEGIIQDWIREMRVGKLPELEPYML